MTEVSALYGKSMYALAETESITDRVLEDFALVTAALEQHAPYVALLDAPTVTVEEKCNLLTQAFAQHVHPYTLNFLKILAQKKQMHTFFAAQRIFKEQYNTDRGIEEAIVITAIPLSQGLTEKLTQKLSEMTGKKIVLENKVDAGILGGLTVRMANTQLDASVRTRLDALKAQIMNN